MAAIPAATLWAYAAMASAALSAGVAAYGSYESGKASKKAGEYNARLQENQAQVARNAAALRAEDAEKAAKRQMGTIRASYAKSGVDIDAGTPLLLMMDTARENAKDQVRIKYGGEVDSDAYLASAGLSRIQGNQAYSQGKIGAGTSLLTGGARAAGIAYKHSLEIGSSGTPKVEYGYT